MESLSLRLPREPLTLRPRFECAVEETGDDRELGSCVDLANVEKQMNALGAPWTPGRIPQLPQ
jgi:hypothetical protein